MRILAPLLLMGLVAACATVPMDSAQQDAAGKQFAPPPPGRAALYVYRESLLGSAVSIPVSLGTRPLGSLPSDTWFLVDVEPGTYDVRCNATEGSDARSVTLAPGETRYVEVAIRMGMLGARCGVSEVDPQAGQKGVLGGKRAAEIR